MPVIATWNVNSLRARLPHLRALCAAKNPDIVALQETKVTDDDFPVADIEAAGYHALFTGQKSYNGVAMLARTPGVIVATDLPDMTDPQRRVLAVKYGEWLILNLYVPNGSEVGSEKYAYKLAWLNALIAYAPVLLEQHAHVVLLGDFNIAPEDRDVHDPAAWEGSVLVSAPERERLTRLLAAGFVDVFRSFTQPDRSFSWWDYRAANYRRNNGLRIDLILAATQTAKLCRSCEIYLEPRGWERPSDHAPVVADFAGEPG